MTHGARCRRTTPTAERAPTGSQCRRAHAAHRSPCLNTHREKDELHDVHQRISWTAHCHRLGNMAFLRRTGQSHGLRAPLMDKLQAMTTFVRVVEARSFSKAAETLSMPRSSVTTIIKTLEAHLGTPLLRRSTRSLSLTEAGARYFASCQAILSDIESAESDVSVETN